MVKLLSVGTSKLIVASFPATVTFKPEVKFKEVALAASVVPSSFTSNGAFALIIDCASIVTPESIRSVPSNRMCLLALPNTILPALRSIKAPVSEPPGALFASGILPPFIVPAVMSPKSAESADMVAV